MPGIIRIQPEDVPHDAAPAVISWAKKNQARIKRAAIAGSLAAATIVTAAPGGTRIR